MFEEVVYLLPISLLKNVIWTLGDFFVVLESEFGSDKTGYLIFYFYFQDCRNTWIKRL